MSSSPARLTTLTIQKQKTYGKSRFHVLKCTLRLAWTTHPHRFRDTVAVRLLENAVPLERVAKILGHKSVRVTERSYGPWVRALQETLEADVTRVWEGRKDRPKLVRVK